MPTGYTAAVATGECKSFREYALLCARAFGALVHMRDDKLGEEIRPREPSSYNADQARECKQELLRLVMMREDQWQAEAEKEYAERVAFREKYNSEQAAQKSRYQAMLAHARAWNPPTPEHAEMGRFMVKQLEESIRFDIHDGDREHEIVRSTGAKWYEKRKTHLEKQLAYHEKADSEERERARLANEWLSDLYNSIPKD